MAWPNCQAYLTGPTSPYVLTETGDDTPYFDPDTDTYREQLARCLFIGDVPDGADVINNNEPSVIHGKVVFDPTP